MVPVFKYGSITASNTPVESSFNILKRMFSQKTLPIRADDFLFVHIRSLEGSMIVTASKKADNPKEKPLTTKKDVVQKQTVNINDF